MLLSSGAFAGAEPSVEIDPKKWRSLWWLVLPLQKSAPFVPQELMPESPDSEESSKNLPWKCRSENLSKRSRSRVCVETKRDAGHGKERFFCKMLRRQCEGF